VLKQVKTLLARFRLTRGETKPWDVPPSAWAKTDDTLPISPELIRRAVDALNASPHRFMITREHQGQTTTVHRGENGDHALVVWESLRDGTHPGTFTFHDAHHPHTHRGQFHR